MIISRFLYCILHSKNSFLWIVWRINYFINDLFLSYFYLTHLCKVQHMVGTTRFGGRSLLSVFAIVSFSVTLSPQMDSTGQPVGDNWNLKKVRLDVRDTRWAIVTPISVVFLRALETDILYGLSVIPVSLSQFVYLECLSLSFSVPPFHSLSLLSFFFPSFSLSSLSFLCLFSARPG